MSLSNLCSNCTACSFSTPGKEIGITKEPESLSQVLVLDDRVDGVSKGRAFEIAYEIVPVNFTYSRTIRCDTGHELSQEQEAEGRDKCSVWTHLIVRGFPLILTTPKGAGQLMLHEVKVGSIYRAGHLGLVLIIPPLGEMAESEYKTYRVLVRRCLKSIGAIA